MRHKDRIAVYIRLSQADEETGRGKDESNSVVSQRKIINSYLDGREELALLPRREFVDDGFSGTNTDRPAFLEMIRLIRDGEFNICITKDFSRFARDYVETGDYLECVFPFLGVRYISINDGYDSDDYKGTTGGLEVALRNFIYDSYSRDVSIKISASKKQLAKKGRRLGNRPCYGYMPDPERRGLSKVDPEAAAVVKRIFEAALGGMGTTDIALMLNSEGVLCPSVYYAKKYGVASLGLRKDLQWDGHSVRKILRRLSYTGKAVGGVRKKVSYNSRKYVYTPDSEWVVVNGVNEAIVSQEEFDRVQELLPRKRRGAYVVRDYPLKSKVFCGCCGRHASRGNGLADPKYRCNGNIRGGRTGCLGVLSPKESLLEEMVFDGIREIIDVVGAVGVGGYGGSVVDYETRVAELRLEIQRLNARKRADYEGFSSGEMSREAFFDKKRQIDARVAEIEGEIADIMRRFSEGDCDSGIASVCERFSGEEKLTREMIEAFVDRIEIFPDERVEIRWRFNLESYQAEMGA